VATDTRAPGEELALMLRIEARGAGRHAGTPESFWGATARGDLLARMALAAIGEANAAPTSLHASFLAEAEPDREVEIRVDAPVAAQRRVHLDQRGAPICDATFRFDPPSGELTYRSASPHWAVERRLGPAFPTTDLALHDFALWIHRPARWDDF